MKKSRLGKFLIMLGCVIMVALPVLFINSKPIVAHASVSYTSQFKSIMATEDIDSFNSYVTTNQAEISSTLADFEIKYAINYGKLLLADYVEQQNAIINDEASTEEQKTAATEAINTATTNYNTSAETLNLYYQDDALPATLPAGQNTATYQIGNTTTYKRIGDNGFTVSAGQSVRLEIVGSGIVALHGPITVREGGTLEIVVTAEATASGSHMKREIEETLRVGSVVGDVTQDKYIDGDEANGYNFYYSNNLTTLGAIDTSVSPNNSGYIPAGATDGVVTQFSGAMFVVNGGTLNMSSNNSRQFNISGAGQFNFNTANVNSSGQCITFPINNSTSGSADDVESSRPVFHVNDPANYDTVLSLNNVSIQYNNNCDPSSSVYGGAFNVEGNSPVVVIENSRILKCRSYRQGGFMQNYSSAGGTVSLISTSIESCYTDAPGATEGGTYRTLGGSHCLLYMEDTTFNGNYSRQSAGAFLWSAMPAGELIVKDCTIQNNTSYTGTGAIICMGQMSIEGSTTISGNKSLNGSGGAISFSNWGSATPNNTFQLENNSNLHLGPDVVIQNNFAKKTGGAINFDIDLIRIAYGTANERVLSTKQDGSDYEMRLIIDGSTISNNTSQSNGGAVYIRKLSGCPYVVDVTMLSGMVSNNQATGNGGAFYLSGNGVDFLMESGTVTGNSTDAKGGGVYVTSGGKATVNGGSITSNSADHGGGAYIDGGDAIISGGNVTSNTATYSGGGIYVANGSLSFSDGTISSNIAQTNGGGAYIDNGNATISGGTISGNQAENSAATASIGKGGGIYITNGNLTVESGDFLNNSAYFEGGGLYVSGADCTATLNGGTVKDNTVLSGTGGGMYLYRASLEINGGTLTGNTAPNGAGGGACVNSATFTVKGNSVISGNSAMQGGAAFVVSGQYGSGNFVMENGDVSQNSATGDGGAIYIQGDSYFTIRNGTISNNSSALDGGAVYIKDSGSFTMDDGKLDENESGGEGGAVYIKGNGNFIMNDGSLEENTANTTGGAVYMLGAGSFTMKKGYLKNNTANNFAGAVSIDGGGSFEMFDGTISGNKTLTNSGGAVRVQGGGSFIMHNGTISGNVAKASAGAIRMTNGNFTMYNGLIENNSCSDSGGFMYMQGGTCTIYNGIIRNNHKTASLNTGGAILINSSGNTPGSFIMINGEISGNTSVEQAGAISIAGGSTFEMRGGLISGNRASKNGGAVYISDGNFNMSGGRICDNTAGTNGGSVYIRTGDFFMSAGDITDNSASEDGGAVYINSGDFEMTGGNISGNTTTGGDGGGVFVNVGSFTITSGTLENNKSVSGYGGAVFTGGTVTVGAENCNGDLAVDNHPSCPVISNNSAVNGGAFAVNGGNPTIHCGSITDNTASANGGAMYVTNGSVLVNYVVMERNTAASGAGFCIEALTQNLSVTVLSGYIRYNQATEGGGLKVYASGTYVATVVVGKQGCDGAVDSTHKHPDISSNIAEGEGGGLHLVSDSANGILFTMWCGRLHQNIANENIPTGNMIQEGGQVSIHGTYTIDNVTVNNGSYLRPSFGTNTVTLGFDYRFPDGYTSDANELKSITLTIGEGDSRDMYINLPAYHNVALNDTTMILLRWSESPDNNNVTYETASMLIVNETNFTAGENVTLYGVWIAQGAGIAEVPYVTNGQQFDAWQDGSSVAIDISADGFFTALFEVSECDPSKFGERYLTFSRPFAAGTVITLVDLTAKSGYKNYYCYVINGEETTVSLSSFTKLGSPLVHWSNSRTDDTGDSEEDLMFMFDLGLSSETFTGSFWISLTRAYVDTTKAPISQTVSCAISEVQTPEISAPTESNVSDSVEITYVPGMAAEEDSVYYGKAAALVISGKETSLPPESYILIGETKYAVNTSGVIVIPIGDAKNEATLSMQLISSALTNSEMGIELNVDLYMCVDATRPMNDKLIYSTEISMRAIPLPAVSISMEERIFYLENLPASVAIDVVQENIGDKYRLDWAVLKQSFGGAEYGDVNGEAAVTDGVLTFGQNISEGNFRIVVTVVDKETDAEALTVVYNFIVLDSQ